jgi:thioredoxin reductase
VIFDVLIIGGGPAGVSCALVLGSAQFKPYAADKKIAIVTHQKNSNLQEALFFNAYGIKPGKPGAELMAESLQHLSAQYPHVTQISGEKVMSVSGQAPDFTIATNKSTYRSKAIVVAANWTNTFAIEGLTQYLEPHAKSVAEKQRIQLRNTDHKVTEGIYVAGTLAGWRNQIAISAGSGAAVATDILTAWNGGVNSQSHDSIKK